MEVEKILSHEENKDLDNFIKENILLNTCQLFEKGGKYGYKPIGTGVIVEIENEGFILTASHITCKLNSKNTVYTITNNIMTPITGKVSETDLEKNENIDVAFIRLNKDFSEILKKSYNFLPKNKIETNHKLLSTAQYVTVGYPEGNLNFENNIVKTKASFFIHSQAKEKVYKYYKFDKKYHYIVEHAGKGIDVVKNIKSKFNTELYGMSGCGLWHIIAFNSENKICYDYRLIGIMTEFRKSKYFVLIGCKIEIIMHEICY